MSYNTKTWRYRVQIMAHGPEASAIVEADTHPGEPNDAELDDSFTALGASELMEKVSGVIHDYHALPEETAEGARTKDLMRRIPTLRVYLSTHGGRTTLRIPYTPDNATARLALLTVERPDVR